jgi:hypothetical protein
LIRVYGNTAVNTGYYTFSYTKDGETKSIPARYSFTFVKDGNEWKIVDHHSSATHLRGRPPTTAQGAITQLVAPWHVHRRNMLR